MMRIYKMLRDGNYEQAVLLLRAAREVWPDDESFGKSSRTPEEDLMLLKEIYVYLMESGKCFDINYKD
jgi:timeless